MAVESGHLTASSTFLNNQMMKAVEHHPNANLYSSRLAYSTAQPLSAAAAADARIPMYSSGFTDFITPVCNTAPLKADDSGLTCSTRLLSRKRSRDSASVDPFQNVNPNRTGYDGTFTPLGEHISLQIQRQQLEIDQLFAQHTETVRIEVEERRKRNSSRIIAAVEEKLSKRLRAKEEEVVKLAKYNFALEERVRSLFVESQIWRELAQTHEATAYALRGNLEQVLEHVVQDDDRRRSATEAAALADDAQSCCESNNKGCNDDSTSSSKEKRWCKTCGKEESCVLLLPCRHLCLCTVCASSVSICPLCKSATDISVQVNVS